MYLVISKVRDAGRSPALICASNTLSSPGSLKIPFLLRY
jgi:hypothetical protein